MKRLMSVMAMLLLAASIGVMAVGKKPADVPAVHHSSIGDGAKSSDGSVKLTVVGKKCNYAGVARADRDSDVFSPKSVHFHPNGTKYYINSLEGCMTMVYDAKTNEKLSVIKHRFSAKNAHLWATPSGLFPFTHYTKNLNTFWGKPVESTFSHGGRYLWIPYYRRSYDINAQDPSALAVIDTRVDTIVKVFETGPLPKMVATSHNGKYLAVTHWGNNTVGVLDISGSQPSDWHYVKCLVVDHQLQLNFSLTTSVDRDSHSGYLLRGTVFTPDDHYMLIACMGGGGGIAVIDMQKMEYVGRLTGVYNARHLVVKNGYLYASLNSAGIVERLPLTKVEEAIGRMNGKTSPIGGWETCQVGRGARTISLSPSGNYAFAACNSASQLCVIDTRTMKQIATLALDSYPVGLDVSADGRLVVVTSQGRKGFGGNAVNLVRVDYATPEPNLLETETAAPSDTANADVSDVVEGEPVEESLPALIPIGIVAILLCLLLVMMMRKNRKNRRR